MSLLHGSSFPVIVLFLWALIETLPFLQRALRSSRWWIAIAWFCRPLAIWAAFNSVQRLFAPWGFNDRETFPFYFNLWTNKETWFETLRRLAHHAEFWRWSCVVLLLGILFVLLCKWILSQTMTKGKTAWALICLFLFSILLPFSYDCLPGGVGDLEEEQGSFLSAWFEDGNTMLYCLHNIKTKGDYLRRFEEIQPRMARFIHGASHPPGATLALYWVGQPFGAGQSIRHDKLRYALGHTAFSAFCVLAMFLLGRSLFRSNEIGLMSAALWVVKPATLVYNVFAPDTIYTVFYILTLAFSWRVVTSEKRPWLSMVGLGLSLYALTMLNFNWPMLVGIFGVFLLIWAYLKKVRPTEWLLRGIVPVALMAGLLLWTCLHYRLNYVNIFLYALKFNRTFYGHLNTVYRWVSALIGGQIDLCLLSGSFCAYVFWRNLPRRLRECPLSPALLFFLIILVIYLIPVIALNSVKMEASRVWAWISAVPIAWVAYSLRNSEYPRFYFLMAAIFSMIQYYGMRLFLVSAG